MIKLKLNIIVTLISLFVVLGCTRESLKMEEMAKPQSAEETMSNS